MKWMFAIAAIALLAGVRAEFEEDTDANDARLGYVTVNADGSTSLTFNATSIQNAVILGLFLLVLGALIIPLLGGLGDDSGYGYGGGYEQTGYSSGGGSGGYDAPSSGYNTYAKRSVEALGPVMDALSSAYKQYEEEE